MTIRRREPGIDDEPRAVLHQGVADEAELRLHAGSLAVEPGLGVGRALVGLIRALLALEVDLEIAPATRGRIIGIPLSLGSEALHRGPRLDESTIDAEVFARQESLHSRLSQNRIEELRRGIALEEPIAVFREHRVIPDRIVDRQANKPAKQQVELHPLHQLPLGADRVESLQEHCPQKHLGWDRGPTRARVQFAERHRQRPQRRIGKMPDCSQRVIRPTRASRSTYENNDPERLSDPRIRPSSKHPRRVNHAQPSAAMEFFNSLLVKPGGNATGFLQFEYSLSGKWPELLKEIVPAMTRAAVIRDAATPYGIGQFAVIQSVAPSLGLEVSPINLRGIAETERAIASFARFSSGGMIVTASPISTDQRDLIVALATRYKLPTVYFQRLFVLA